MTAAKYSEFNTWSVPPVALASYAPNATAVVVTIRCTTASGTTVIGSTDLTVTFSIPATVVPTLGTIVLTKVNSNATVDGWGIYLQNYSQCGVSITGSSGVYDSTISSYSVKVGSMTVGGEGSGRNANWSGTSEVLTVSGSILVNITCTDSRGRTATATRTITVHEYSAPTILGAQCYRSDSGNNSTELDDGTYIYAYARLNYSGADNHNTASMTLNYRAGTSGSYTSGGTLPSEVGTKFGGGAILVSTPWEVVITAVDALGNTNAYTFQLPTGMAAVHIRPGGTGICFGGYSQHNDSVAIADGLSFLAGNSIIRTSLPAAGIEGQFVLLISVGSLIPYVYTGNAWVSTLLSAYPVGAIYMSTVATDPGTLFGGTWARIEDRFLLAAGGTYTAGSTGGAATVTLTANQSGQRALSISGGGHSHTVHAKHGTKFASGSTRGFHNDGDAVSNSMAYIDANTGTHSHSVSAANASEAHENMPPYLVVYAWQRTA